jgi:hypothetical protein
LATTFADHFRGSVNRREGTEVAHQEETTGGGRAAVTFREYATKYAALTDDPIGDFIYDARQDADDGGLQIRSNTWQGLKSFLTWRTGDARALAAALGAWKRYVRWQRKPLDVSKEKIKKPPNSARAAARRNGWK